MKYLLLLPVFFMLFLIPAYAQESQYTTTTDHLKDINYVLAQIDEVLDNIFKSNQLFENRITALESLVIGEDTNHPKIPNEMESFRDMFGVHLTMIHKLQGDVQVIDQTSQIEALHYKILSLESQLGPIANVTSVITFDHIEWRENQDLFFIFYDVYAFNIDEVIRTFLYDGEGKPVDLNGTYTAPLGSSLTYNYYPSLTEDMYLQFMDDDNTILLKLDIELPDTGQ